MSWFLLDIYRISNVTLEKGVLLIFFISMISCSQSEKNRHPIKIKSLGSVEEATMSNCYSKVTPGDSMKLFDTYEELHKWATESTFGGGRLIELEGKRATYFIVDRMYTSGMITSETSVYKNDMGKYRLVYYLPLQYVARSYKIEEDRLIIIERSSDGEDRKIVIDEKEL